MSIVRRFLTIPILIGLVAVSVASTVQVLRQGLPDPEVAEQGDLIEWLSSREMMAEPREKKLRLARRMELDFQRGIDWQTDLARLDDDQWQQFRDNFNELMQIWFLDKVETYFAMPESQRDEYLDQEIVNLMSWRVIQDRASTASGNGRQMMQLDELVDQIQQWLEWASPRERGRMMTFLQAVQDRLFTRAFERMRPTHD